MKKYYKSKVFLLLIISMLVAKLSAAPIAEDAVKSDNLPEFDCLIEPGEIVDVGSPAHGVIENVFVDRGDYVAQGQPLSKLNSSVEQAALELARTRASSTVEIALSRENAEFSKRLHARNQALFSKSAISSHEMDRLATEQTVAQMYEQEAKNKNEIAKMELRRAQEVVNQKTIFSPINGVVMEKYKSAGEYVENEPLLRVVQLDPLRIEVIVAADYWGQLTPGQSAQVRPEFNNLKIQVAQIERIDPVVDSASGTFRVQLTLPNPEHQIAAGLKCQLAFMPMAEQVKPEKDARFSPAKKALSYVGVTAADAYRQQEITEGFAHKSVDHRVENTSLIIDGYGVRSKLLTEQAQVKVFTLGLKSKKISDFYVKSIKGKGYQVSLGLYRNRENALGRVEKLKTLGFDVEFSPRYKKCTLCGQQTRLAAANGDIDKSELNLLLTKPGIALINKVAATATAQSLNSDNSTTEEESDALSVLKNGVKTGQKTAENKQEGASTLNGYYVRSRYLPLRAEVKAFTARLKAKNIRDFFVKKAPEQDGYQVSLGLFRRQENALRRVNTLQKLGFEVEISSRELGCTSCQVKGVVAKSNSFQHRQKAQTPKKSSVKISSSVNSILAKPGLKLVKASGAKASVTKHPAGLEQGITHTEQKMLAQQSQNLDVNIRDYAVYSASLLPPTQVKAFTARLKAENIRDFYIKKNREAGGYLVALGVYQQFGNAFARVSKLKALGFEVSLNPRYKKCENCRQNNREKIQTAAKREVLTGEAFPVNHTGNSNKSVNNDSFALARLAP